MIKADDKLGLSCAKLNLALASYLLLWTICEFDMAMDNGHVMKKNEKVMNKS